MNIKKHIISAINKRFFLPLMMLCGLLSTNNCFAQDYEKENQVKALFVFNFTRFMDWPQESFSTGDSPLIIGVIGNESMYSYIDEVVKGERIGTRPIIIQQFAYPEQIKNCHLLYIGLTDPDLVKKILNNKQHGNAITISDAPNFLRWGGSIRFYTEQDKLRFEINTEKAKQANVRISSKLLGVAKIY